MSNKDIAASIYCKLNGLTRYKPAFNDHTEFVQMDQDPNGEYLDRERVIATVSEFVGLTPKERRKLQKK